MSRRRLVPNLLYNSTYALNGSYSKFVHIGLDYAVGYFRPVIRFSGHTGPDKYVLMDIESWDQLKTHFNTFEAYLCGRSEFLKHGKYVKIYLPHHDTELTNSYGSRTVAITERPQVPPPPFEHEGQQFEFEDDNANQEAPSRISSEKPLTKKKWRLRSLRRRLWDKIISGFVNRVFGIMIDVIKTEAIRKKYEHLLDRKYIGLIFTELEDKMKELALNQLMFSNFSESSFEILFLEIYAEYLTILENNVVTALKV